MKSFFAVVLMLLTPFVSQAFSESDCRITQKPNNALFDITTMVDGSALTADSASAEIVKLSQRSTAEKVEIKDQFGQVRGLNVTDTKSSEEVRANQDECAPYYGAKLVEKCSQGEDTKLATCKTFCRQFYNSFVRCN